MVPSNQATEYLDKYRSAGVALTLIIDILLFVTLGATVGLLIVGKCTHTYIQ